MTYHNSVLFGNLEMEICKDMAKMAENGDFRP